MIRLLYSIFYLSHHQTYMSIFDEQLFISAFILLLKQREARCLATTNQEDTCISELDWVLRTGLIISEGKLYNSLLCLYKLCTRLYEDDQTLVRATMRKGYRIMLGKFALARTTISSTSVTVNADQNRQNTMDGKTFRGKVRLSCSSDKVTDEINQVQKSEMSCNNQRVHN